ncbi:PRTRC system protein A [Burkholderia vietnamiensis]|uniref:PRTRC system protein A n=1 Tax=Burkholderia vietnamiensis TaxID=60552 RepID=UPI001D132E97|nr:PRTRC system protein A [Burkholderia vietnamiensis]UEC01653.1 PRTRC system protein A [Burkholderia vietnamiensis]
MMEQQCDPPCMDPRDIALQASCPVLAAPRFGVLPDMANGQRLIVAANGVFVQVRLDWLDCLQRLTPAIDLPLPYGGLEEHLRFAFGVLPIRLLDAFVEAGRRGLPNEVAGVLIYRRATRSLRLALCEPLYASPGRIEYRRPEMESDETVAVDLHTHGRGLPFWSSDDNRDDQGIKVAGVFGCLHQSRPLAEFRLVVNGRYKALSHPWQPQPTASGAPSDAALEDAVEPGLLHRILKRWPIRQNSRGLPWNT